MALAAATVFESQHYGWLAGAVVVDHQLQRGSAEVAAAVSDRLRELGCEPVEILTVGVGSLGGLEAAAREARYAALGAAAARHSSVVLLGHTRDDQAETVLLGLARGSGTRSLAGMAPVRAPFRRPLLQVSREQTRAACDAARIEAWEDPHNSDERFARVRVRREVLPLLERTLGPGVAEALARTAELARGDADALDQMAVDLRQRALAEDGGLCVAVLAQSPAAVRRRVVRQQAVAAGAPAGEVSAVHVEAVDRLVTHWHGQRGVDLPGHLVARREADELFFVSTGSPA